MLYDLVFRATTSDYGYIGRSFAVVIQGFLLRSLINRGFSGISASIMDRLNVYPVVHDYNESFVNRYRWKFFFENLATFV